MKVLSLIFVLGLGLGICSSISAQEGFELPADNETPIFTMDFTGGLRAPAPKDFVRLPYLQVFPDGRVVNSSNSPDRPANEFHLDQAQLNDFLNKVVNDCEVYEIDGDKIANQIKESGQRIMIADAPSLAISVELGRGKHDVSVFAASVAARQFPDIEELQNLAKIEAHARRLVRIASIGGYEEANRILGKVNEALEAEGHDPMTMDNLHTCQTVRGRFHVSFNRKTMEGKRTVDWVNGKFTRNGEEETVKVTSRGHSDQRNQLER